MMEKECVDDLLNPSLSIEGKAESLGEYIRRSEALAHNLGLGIRTGRSLAIDRLFAALPKHDGDATQRLRDTLHEIEVYMAKLREQRLAEVEASVSQIRILKPGTAIVIQREGQEEIVRLIEVKRTRFVCEYPDGRQYSVPSDLFLRVYEGEIPPRLSDDERRKRELARALGGSSFQAARMAILQDGVAMIQSLLDELAATFDRIENAPMGASEGFFGPYLGMVKKVNTHDQALAKRAAEIIAEIAVKGGMDEVLNQIRQHSERRAQFACISALAAATAPRRQGRQPPAIQWPVKATRFSAVASASPGGAFSVNLTAAGDNRIGLILSVHEVAGLSIHDAKRLVDAIPEPLFEDEGLAITENVSRQEAEWVRDRFVEAGARVDIRPFPPAQSEMPADPNREYSVVITNAGSSKISLLAAVREITGFGLKEAKDLVESDLPIVVRRGVDLEWAREARRKLARAGAVAEIR